MWFQLNFFPLSLSSLLFLSKQGKVFHEAVAPFRLAFPSLTLVPAPVPARAGGASAGSPSAPGGAGRGAGFRPAHGCSRPARTPRRRAQLARGPSEAPGRPGARQRLSGEAPASGNRDVPPPPPLARR
ncbi:PREDICTED: codanin-1-like [Cercocebus atys]|uniref:codanin-1-like n=1 Tax=Cercocebus atys TaxID=9531 RepID=UPI0005F4E46B|nr:PREDICTED: codanin-1-like [Cercocebus atys]